MAISKIRITNKFPFIVQCIVDCGCVGTLSLSKRHLLWYSSSSSSSSPCQNWPVVDIMMVKRYAAYRCPTTILRTDLMRTSQLITNRLWIHTGQGYQRGRTCLGIGRYCIKYWGRMTCVINAISFTLIRVLLASINISSKEETLEMQCLPFANSDHSPNDTLAITNRRNNGHKPNQRHMKARRPQHHNSMSL